MTTDIQYMQRCLQLAKLGEGTVAPNPMVGAVLVYQNRIIGEGYHQKYGGPHAEVNCLASVNEADLDLISDSTLYVSLEPCAHFGKTPPCADLIIRNNIHRIVVGCRDPFVEVDGKGIEKLKAAGVQVEMSAIENECRRLNKRFFLFHRLHRPYVILKWAQTADGFIGSNSSDRLMISNAYTNRLVHQWRSEEAAILVGTRTAAMDNPALTTRLLPGKSPLRIVIDKELKLSGKLHLFDGSTPTLVFNELQNTVQGAKPDFALSPMQYCQLNFDDNIVPQIMNALFQLNIQSVLIEGGAHTLQQFIDLDIWDEARVITNPSLRVSDGVMAPVLRGGVLQEYDMMGDLISIVAQERFSTEE